ncbi:MAG TPA: DNA polymerase domain-containing protein [Bacteroidota bacterium]|nr:DNA polymerase domain-containing protein [Bacteroidota bacterium]
MHGTVSGWLFDLYPSADGVTLWLIDRGGGARRCFRKYLPSFFLHMNDADARRIDALGARCPVPVSFRRTVRKEIYSGDSWEVVQVFVHDTTRFKEVVWYFERFFPHFAFYNSDILVAQLFLYETGLFPLALGEYEMNDAGELTGWAVNDSREATEYELPPLSVMSLRNANDFVPPKYQRQIQLEIAYDGRTYALEQNNPADVLEAFNWHLHRCDPDVLLTEYGDAHIMPKLVALSEQHRVPLLLNRDPSAGYATTKESSFFQYGKIIHKDGAFELAGRWHIDVDNSFTVTESELDGLFEMSRLTQTPAQRQGRASIGTSMSSLQLSWAYKHGILIPAKKREPEEFKSAATLLLADRGGLIFNPPLGFHENIAELDFVSMYPTIMVNKNVSPETVNCRCCHNAKVPELEYTICENREGIIPATLRTVVKKRAYYKAMKKKYKGKDEALFRRYDARQSALKWMLVSCFGYLGYKNARFGRIEAHESVNAFSRDAILAAKEIAESHGFEMLHAIIDCMWLRKEGATEAEYLSLCGTIAEHVGIDISLEGIYRWILFPASKQDPDITTANRYVGWYETGEMKMRGIESRRHDTPKFIKSMQSALLNKMGEARTIAELESMLPALLDIAWDHLAILRSGKANPLDLVLRRHITKEAEEYTNNSISAVVSKLVENMGVHLSAGESIEFIILDQSGKRKPEKAKPLALYAFEDGYDIETYTEFAVKAVATLLEPFGYDFEALEEYFNIRPKKPGRARPKNTMNLELEFVEEQVALSGAGSAGRAGRIQHDGSRSLRPNER